MRKVFSLLFAIAVSGLSLAQAPEKMSYQAVIRDGSNNLVSSSTVGMQISILQGSATGSAVYVETHTTSTNSNGLASIEIGAGSVVTGNFSAIDWANGPYFVKTETDPTGGTNYTITGTSQLLSVPYALYAGKAESSASGGKSLRFPDGTDGDPIIVSPSSSYTVPSGKTLHITGGWSDQWNNGILISSDTVSVKGPGIIKENTTLNTSDQAFTGLVVDKGVEVVQWRTDTSYTLPTGKTFYLFVNPVGGEHFLNGAPVTHKENGTIMTIPGGTIVEHKDVNNGRTWIFTGYLR